jgi:glycosyltransferase involved in cell wall biosynthesis
MHILFLTDNFPPEVNAPASRTFEHAKEWIRLGAQVTVVTCSPNFPAGKIFEGYHNRWRQIERSEGLNIIRVWSYISANSGFIRRIVDFISFSITSFLASCRITPDLIIATSPQFFTALSGKALSKLKNVPWIMEVRDLWPDQILENTNIRRNIFIRYLEYEEYKCYTTAAKVVVVTDSYKDRIIEKGIHGGKIAVIKNGVDLNMYFPKQKDDFLLKRYDLGNKLIVGYIGTHGLSQNLNWIIGAIDEFNKTNSDIDIRYLFVGGGAEKESLVRKVNTLNAKNILFIDEVPKYLMTKYLSLLDIGLVPLKKSELYKKVIPSKIFELAAMRIPILLGVDGEARTLVENYNCGLYYEPENEKQFHEQLLKLVDKGKRCELSVGGLNLARNFTRKNNAELMYNELLNAVN